MYLRTKMISNVHVLTLLYEIRVEFYLIPAAKEKHNIAYKKGVKHGHKGHTLRVRSGV